MKNDHRRRTSFDRAGANVGQGRTALVLGILLHVMFVASLFSGFLNPIFIEAVRGYGQAGDYFGIYRAGRNLTAGTSIYDVDKSTDPESHRVPYFYFYRYLPPTAYVAALAAIALPPWTAYWIWVAITELLLLLVVFSILRLDAYPIRERRYHAGLWLGFFPFYLEQWMGQFSFLMAVFLWVIFRALMRDQPAVARRQAPRRASLWAWAAAVAVKSFPALFALTFLRQRNIRPVLFCGGLVILVCLPHFLIHPDDLGRFLAMNFPRNLPMVHMGTMSGSAFGRLLGWELLPPEIAARLVDFRIFDVRVGTIPALGMNALVVGTTLFLFLRHGRRGPTDLQLALWVLTFFLVFTEIWEYHYVMLLPLITAIGLSWQSRFVLCMGVLLALPTPFVLFARADHTLPLAADLLEHAWKPLPTYALFFWTTVSVVKTLRLLPAPASGSVAGEWQTQ